MPRRQRDGGVATVTAPSRRRPGGLWLLAIVLVAFNLRPLVTSVPPLIDALSSRYGLSAVAAGALTTLPVICMGAFAPAAAMGARRYGASRVVAVAVGLIAVGVAGRAVGGVALLYLATAVAGAGIAVAGAMLPSLVRERASGRVGPLTGLYTAVLIGGAFMAAGGTEPLRDLLDLSAQAALAVWAVPAVLALAVWLVATHPRIDRARDGTNHDPQSADPPWIDRGPQLMIGDDSGPRTHDHGDRASGDDSGGRHGSARAGDDGGRGERGVMPWRSRAAWLGTLFMGLQSLLFYAALAWLAATYTSLGMSAGTAGLLLGVFSATQIVTALAMPALAHRSGLGWPWVAVSMGLTIAGLLLVATAPLAAPWIWAAVLGLGMGGNLSLALTVITQIAPTPQAASAYAGMAFFVGYLLAALGPVAAGALRDLTGGFATVYLALAGLGVVTLAIGLGAARARPDPPSPV